MPGFSESLEIVVKPSSKKLITWVYEDDDYDKDDEDGQVNDDVEDGEDAGYEDDDEDGQVNVHVTAFGDHAQNTGIYSIFCSLCNMLRKDVEQDTLSQAS